MDKINNITGSKNALPLRRQMIYSYVCTNLLRRQVQSAMGIKQLQKNKEFEENGGKFIEIDTVGLKTIRN